MGILDKMTIEKGKITPKTFISTAWLRCLSPQNFMKLQISLCMTWLKTSATTSTPRNKFWNARKKYSLGFALLETIRAFASQQSRTECMNASPDWLKLMWKISWLKCFIACKNRKCWSKSGGKISRKRIWPKEWENAFFQDSDSEAAKWSRLISRSSTAATTSSRQVSTWNSDAENIQNNVN